MSKPAGGRSQGNCCMSHGATYIYAYALHETKIRHLCVIFCGSHVLSLSSIVLFVIGFHLIISHSRPLPFMGAEFFIHTGVDPTIHQTYGLQTFKDCHPIVGLEVHVLQTAWSKNVPQKQIRVVRFRMFDDTALSLSSLLLVMAKVGNGPQKAPHHCSTGMPRCAQMDWICAMCKWVGHQLQHVQTSRCFAIIQFQLLNASNISKLSARQHGLQLDTEQFRNMISYVFLFDGETHNLLRQIGPAGGFDWSQPWHQSLHFPICFC